MRFSLRLNNDLPLPRVHRPGPGRRARRLRPVLGQQRPVSAQRAGDPGRRRAGHHAASRSAACILNPYTIHPAEIAMFAATHGRTERQPLQPGPGRGRGRVPEVGRPGAGQTVGDDARDHRRHPRAVARRARRDGRRLPALDRRGLPALPGAARHADLPRRDEPEGMLRLAGELCDGALPLLFPPEHYFGVRPIVDEGRKRRRDAGDADRRLRLRRVHLGVPGRGPRRPPGVCWLRRWPTTATRSAR